MGKRKKIQYVEPEELVAVIEDATSMGEGLARKDGEPVLIPFTIQGEEVVAEIKRRGHDHLEADLVRVVKPSPHRVTPRCPYYGACTGCQWQHIDYGHQLELKRRNVAEQIKRIGGFENPPVPPTLGCPDPWGYRNHARLTVRHGQLGFVNKATRRFARIDRCMIMHEGVNKLLAALQEKCGETTQLSIRYGVATNQWLIQPTLHSPDVTVATGQTSYEEALMGRRFQVSSPSFFQVNTRQAERLTELVWARLNLSGRETLVDAYAGVGTFAALLSPYAKRVIAIEESSAAVTDMKQNIAGLANVELVLGRTEDVLSQLPEVPDAVVLDPPRTGCMESALRALTEAPRGSPPRVVYVSCDPASLARDLRILCEGAYDLLEAQPVDMFPHTHHVETVATLQRKKPMPRGPGA